MADTDEQETCPSCPPAGPPVYIPTQNDQKAASSHSTTAPAGDEDADDEDISWISCSKCSTWYHGVCVLISGDYHKPTVPGAVLEYIADQPRAEWTNWTGWVGRW